MPPRGQKRRLESDEEEEERDVQPVEKRKAVRAGKRGAAAAAAESPAPRGSAKKGGASMKKEKPAESEEEDDDSEEEAPARKGGKAGKAGKKAGKVGKRAAAAAAAEESSESEYEDEAADASQAKRKDGAGSDADEGLDMSESDLCRDVARYLVTAFGKSGVRRPIDWQTIRKDVIQPRTSRRTSAKKIMQHVQWKLREIFGYDVIEVAPNKYILELYRTSDVSPEEWKTRVQDVYSEAYTREDFSQLGLLHVVLSLIFVSPSKKLEEKTLEAPTLLHRLSHAFRLNVNDLPSAGFGNTYKTVKDLIEKKFVPEGYIGLREEEADGKKESVYSFGRRFFIAESTLPKDIKDYVTAHSGKKNEQGGPKRSAAAAASAE